MIDERKTLGEILSDPLIARIAPDAIRNMDLTKDEKWGKNLAQLRTDCFGGDLAAGFETLFRAAKSGEWYYPLYTEAECAEDAGRKGANLVWLPSKAEDAGSRPYILLVPGGGFENVWNLTGGLAGGGTVQSVGLQRVCADLSGGGGRSSAGAGDGRLRPGHRPDPG